MSCAVNVTVSYLNNSGKLTSNAWPNVTHVIGVGGHVPRMQACLFLRRRWDFLMCTTKMSGNNLYTRKVKHNTRNIIDHVHQMRIHGTNSYGMCRFRFKRFEISKLQKFQRQHSLYDADPFAEWIMRCPPKDCLLYMILGDTSGGGRDKCHICRLFPLL